MKEADALQQLIPLINYALALCISGRKKPEYKLRGIRNIEHAIHEVHSKSPILKEMEEKGEIKVAGAIYQMKTGRVTFL